MDSNCLEFRVSRKMKQPKHPNMTTGVAFVVAISTLEFYLSSGKILVVWVIEGILLLFAL